MSEKRKVLALGEIALVHKMSSIAAAAAGAAAAATAAGAATWAGAAAAATAPGAAAAADAVQTTSDPTLDCVKGAAASLGKGALPRE